jgi:hypothetical protein
MSGKWYFARGGEDAGRVCAGFHGAGRQKNGLGVVKLARNVLHPFGSRLGRGDNHGQLVAAVLALAKDVQDVEFYIFHNFDMEAF